MNDNWNHIKKIADNIGSDLDTEAAWDRFEQRPDRRKRRSIFWWSTGAVGVLALFLLLGFFFIRDHHQSLQKVVAVESINDNSLKNKTTYGTKLDKEQKLDQIALQQRENSNLGSSKAYLQSKLKSKSKFKSKSKSEIKSKEKAQAKSQVHAQAQFEQALVKKQSLKRSGPETSFTELNPLIPVKVDKISKQLIDTETTKTIKLEDTTIEMGSNPIDYKYHVSNSTPIQKPVQVIPTRSYEGANSAATQSRIPININSLPIQTNLHFASSSLQIEDYIQLDNQLSTTNHLFSKSWTIQARHIYGIASRSLAGDDELFTNRRSAQEDLEELNASELLITRQLAPLLSISSGLSFGQYRVKLFEVNQDVIQNVVFEDVLLERLFKGGEFEERRGTFVGSQTITTERTRYQQYQDLSLPIYANLHFKLASKLNLLMSTGASISILNRTKGVTFESTISAGTYQSLDQLNYRSMGLIQGLANVSLSLQLNQHLDIQLGGHVRQDLTSRFKQSEAATDRFKSYGVILGIQHRF